MSNVWTIVMICTLIAFFLGLIFWSLNVRFPKKHYDAILGFIIIILSIIAILCSIFLIGGWEGMGVGFIAALILGGTIIALIISTIIKVFSPHRDKTKTY
ncbi:YesK family protein [Peribacillus loiseleuriae]|uniref:YesK family protein n=1 Tax=Peribacillus loiseleuriae TaxID=1679170 RepID=UPI003D056FC7